MEETLSSMTLNPKIIISIITVLGTASVAYWKFKGSIQKFGGSLQILELKLFHRFDNIEKGLGEVKESVKVLEEKQDIMEQRAKLKSDRKEKFEDALTQAIQYYPCERLKRFAIEYVETFAKTTLDSIDRISASNVDEIGEAADIKRKAIFDVAEECLGASFAGAFMIWNNEQTDVYKDHIRGIIMDQSNDKKNRLFVASLKHIHDVLSYILKLFHELEVSNAGQKRVSSRLS